MNKPKLYFSLTVIFLASLLLIPANAQAQRDPFTYELTWMRPGDLPVTVRGSDSNILDAIDTLDSDTLLRLVNAQLVEDGETTVNLADIETDGTVSGNLNLRGVVVIVNYTGAPVGEDRTLMISSPTDVFMIETFTAANISALGDELEDFFERNEDDLLTNILREGVRVTPIDLVAGNPESVMGKLVSTAFASGTNVHSYAANGFRWGIDYADVSGAGFESDHVNIPFRYGYTFEDSGAQLIFDFPAYYIETGGAQSAGWVFNLSLRVPLYDDDLIGRWSLTPSAGFGVAGSIDLGSGGVLYSFAINSNYDFELTESLKFSIGNMYGFYKSAPIKIGDFDIEYDLENHVMRHGVSAEWDLNPYFSLRTSYQHTQFFGDDLYVDRHHDLTFDVGWDLFGGGSEQKVYLGFVYTKGDGNDYEGYRMRLHHQF